MWRCNDELRDRAEELHRNSKKDEVAKHYIGDNLKCLLCVFVNITLVSSLL
jgi:hypothetical protein